MKRTLVSLAILSGTTGCVVSTRGGPGTPPELPLPPPVAEAEVPKGPSKIAASHILISYRGANRAASSTTRTREEALAMATALRERALGGEKFAELAKEFSDDKGSAVDGGNLGQFGRSQMVKAFADAAFALEVGQVSAVVESPFGFHVIQRTE